MRSLMCASKASTARFLRFSQVKGSTRYRVAASAHHRYRPAAYSANRSRRRRAQALRLLARRRHDHRARLPLQYVLAASREGFQ